MSDRPALVINLMHNLLAILDDPKHEAVDVAQIRQRIRDDSLFDWLIGRFDGGYVDLSIIKASVEWQAEMLKQLKAIEAEDPTNLSAHYWVENDGICVLAAWVLETISRNVLHLHGS